MANRFGATLSRMLHRVFQRRASGTGPNVFRMLDLSTGHLPEEVCGDLNSYDGVIATEREYGWLLWVPTDDFDERLVEHPDIPAAVVGIWRYAIELDCAYVLIDRDADRIDALPAWDW